MYSFPAHNEDNTPAILTIAGSDSSGGAGIQVIRLHFKARLSALAPMLNRTAGRPENVHSLGLLRSLSRHSPDRAKHERGASSARRTTLVRRGASKSAPLQSVTPFPPPVWNSAALSDVT